MSDRFYSQMADHFNMKPHELNRAFWDNSSPEYKTLVRKAEGKKVSKTSTGKKVTRIDLNNMLTELLGVDIGGAKLPMPTLQAFVDVVKKKTYKVCIPVPSGRLKAPYQEAITKAIGQTVDLDNATVKTMTAFLGALYNE